MSIRTRTALPLALVATLVAAPSLRAQDAVSIAPTSAPVSAPASPVAAGPTTEAAAVGVRHMAAVDETAPQRRGGSAPGVALMIVGGAAILVGIVVGGDAGHAISIGGAVVGLVGLYQYLQ
jgi:hypothetical protein